VSEARSSGADGSKPPRPTGAVQIAQNAVARFVVVLERSIFWLACALLLFLVVTLFCQVFWRYVLLEPLQWSEEGARFGLVWFSMAAACTAAIEGQHFVFRWATLLVSPTARFWLRRVLDVLSVAVLLVVFKLSLDYLDLVARQTAIWMPLNMRVPHAAVSFAAIALTTIYAAETVDAVLSLWTGQTFSARELNEMQVYGQLRPSAAQKE